MEQDYRPSKDLRDSLVVITSSTTGAGAGSMLTLVDTTLTQAANYWNNAVVVILSGNSNGQNRRISGFALGGTITVESAFASVIATNTKYAILGQYAPPTGAGDATAANQTLILNDVGDASASTLGSIYAIIGNPATTIATTLALKPSATDEGVRQVFEASVTVAANVGVPQVIGTVATQACIVESIIVYADTAQTADLVTYPVTGASGVITFLDGADTAAQVLNVADEQLGWTGSVRLATGKTIEITPTGTGATAVDLTVAITYYSSGGNGGVIS